MLTAASSPSRHTPLPLTSLMRVLELLASDSLPVRRLTSPKQGHPVNGGVSYATPQLLANSEGRDTWGLQVSWKMRMPSTGNRIQPASFPVTWPKPLLSHRDRKERREWGKAPIRVQSPPLAPPGILPSAVISRVLTAPLPTRAACWQAYWPPPSNPHGARQDLLREVFQKLDPFCNTLSCYRQKRALQVEVNITSQRKDSTGN